MVIDCFTKWVEVIFYSVLKAKHVAWFIESNIICQLYITRLRHGRMRKWLNLDSTQGIAIGEGRIGVG